MLKRARVTTSWLDVRQFRELGMPDSLKHIVNMPSAAFSKETGRFARGRGKGKGKGRLPMLVSDQEFGFSSRSHSGTNSESIDSFSFGPQYFRPPTPIASGAAASSKFHDLTKEVKRERLDSVERPDSRTSLHSQSSWGEGEREASRKRRDFSPPVKCAPMAKGKAEDVDRGEKEVDKKKASRMLYVPRMKRKREEGNDASSATDPKCLKSVFDRLGPTWGQEKDVSHHEMHGDSKTQSATVSPTISSGKDDMQRPSSESARPAAEPEEDGKKEKAREREESKDKSSKRGSEPHTGSAHKKKSGRAKERRKSRESQSEHERERTSHGDTVAHNAEREPATATPSAITLQPPFGSSTAMDDPGTPPLPPEHPNLPILQDSNPSGYNDPRWLEYYQQGSGYREQATQVAGPDPNPAGDPLQASSRDTAAREWRQSAQVGRRGITEEAAYAVLQVRDCSSYMCVCMLSMSCLFRTGVVTDLHM